MKYSFEPDWITPELAVGPAPLGPEDYRTLRDMDISFILSLQQDRELKMAGRNPDAEFSVAAGFGMTVYKVQIEDFNGKSLLQKIDEAVDILTELINTGGKVYLHCALGLNRSPTIAVAFLISTKGVVLDDALDQVMSIHTSMPNTTALKEWYVRKESGKRK